MKNIHQMHRDIVHNYPAGVEALGSSPVCKNQGMYIQGKLITVQGHPEFNYEIVTELLERRRDQGIFGTVIFEDSMARVAKDHDGVMIAKVFLRFLMEKIEPHEVDPLTSASCKPSMLTEDTGVVASAY